MAQQYGNSNEISVTMEGPYGGGSGGTTAKLVNVTMSASTWKGASSPFSQIVSLDSVSVNSRVDLLPSVEQAAYLREYGIALLLGNDAGVVTAYAIGNKPTTNLTMQATVTEVIA